MRPIRSVSVLMPTWQGAEFLGRVLEALAHQDLALPWELRVIDSGSTDATLAILAEHAERFPVPLWVESIDQVEFDHGDTRNRLAADSAGDLLVFLTQDAIPERGDWLSQLAANFVDERVAAAYCRNVPRPDAQVLTRLFSAADPGYRARGELVRLPERGAELGPEERRLLYNFNDVASAIRREVWERHPFPRTSFGEDVLMARALLEAGWSIAYDASATVEHSHDYGPAETEARARIDGRFNAEWLGRTCVASAADVEELVRRSAPGDRAALAGLPGLSADRREALAARALELRRAAFRGLFEGGQTRRRRPRTRVLERTRLAVLFVVHGFPPETWAGTEVYTLNLARELARRGHRVSVLARSARGERDFELREDEFEGLRVLRLAHALRHASVRTTYEQPEVARVFREVLAAERPDVVHFQHLIHLSADLVHIAKDEFALPTVVHLHDYWALCARVQLIQPDGTRCAHNRGAGCHACVHERGLSQVARLERLGRERPELVAALAVGRHPRRASAGPRWDGLADLLARQAFVTGAYRAADLCISPSRFLRELFVETAGFDAHTTIYSDNGMRAVGAPLARRPDPEGRLRLGFVGTLVWYKGDRVLLEAMRELAGLPIVLHVFGDFRPAEVPEHAELARLAGPNVVFRGRFDNAELARVYAEIDVLVVPSVWYENSPVTIHEAHLLGTPVVASRLGGMAEYVRDGRDGLTFEAGDARDLARVLRRFVDEPDLCARLSHDWPAIKDIAADARHAEFRYRQLACIDRERKPRLLAELAGHAVRASGGPAERQGAELLLLRPGAWAEYALPALEPRELEGRAELACELELEVLALGGETGVPLGGALWLAGAPLGTIAARAAGAADETRRFRFAVALGAAARVLRIESRVGGRDVFLRIQRLWIRDVPRAAAATSTPAGSPHA